MKNKKIVWLADYTTETHPGGAQITNELIIEEGRNLGFDIDIVDLRNIDLHKIDTKKLYIINNISALYCEYRDKIKEIIDTTKFVRYEHDYLWLATKDYQFVRRVFKNAAGIILLSPLHKYRHEVILSMDFDSARLQPSPVELKIKKTNKNNKAIYLGGIAEHKGINNILKYAVDHPKITIDMYGWVEKQELIDSLPNNVNYCGILDKEEVSKELAKYPYLIHMPNWVEPFGRIIIEALFAGCELITNDKIGALSYDWIKCGKIKEIKKRLDEEKTNFWKYIETV
jgi:hypothetical protein